MAYQLSGLNNIAVQGALVPLDDLLAENAPNFKAFLDGNKAVKSAITASDGKIYVVPFVSDRGSPGGLVYPSGLARQAGAEGSGNSSGVLRGAEGVP
ncbi:hypothetical protein ACFSQ7_11465 [Paenibacillus rhizoplanae]